MEPPQEGHGHDEVKNQQNQQNEESTKLENPYLQASFLSKCFFIWPNQLLQLGLQRPLQETDIPHLMKQESSSFNLDVFTSIWNQELQRARTSTMNTNTIMNTNTTNTNTMNASTRPNLHRALLIHFFQSTWIIQPFMFCASVARITMSIALGNLTQAFIDSNVNKGYLWSMVLVLCNFVVLMEHHHVFFITSRMGMNLRTAAVAAIYDKSLRLSSIGGSVGVSSVSVSVVSGSSSGAGAGVGTGAGVGSNKKELASSPALPSNNNNDNTVSSGQIMNLVSNDVERFFLASLFISYIIWAPLQTIAIFIIGMYLIGYAFAIGMGILVFIFVPMQVYLSKKFASVRSKVRTCMYMHLYLYLL
jgi:ATP-binding cassette subfamily C (CFTR/MRP) protein 4